MSEKPRQHINVDDLQQRLSVRQIAQYYGFALPPQFRDAGEQRMRCPCKDCGGNEDDRSVSINASDPFGRWKCFRGQYGCGAKGNLVTLACCMKHGRMPAGGKPTGSDFYETAQDLQNIATGESPLSVATVSNTTRQEVADAMSEINVPLAESDNAGARKLVHLDEQLTCDVGEMNAAASAYARRHPTLLGEAATACCAGYMPGNAKSTLRGQWVYGVMNEDNQPLCWVGRNVNFEQEQQTFEQRGGKGRERNKFRFPKQQLFRRGLELYGQEFLHDEAFEESLNRHGVILVEGFNDRIRLHELGILSLGIMSNQITAEQVTKTADYARRFADGRVGIMFDLDDKGQEGAKEALWKLHQQHVHAYLVWTKKQLGNVVSAPEPEHITSNEWNELRNES